MFREIIHYPTKIQTGFPITQAVINGTQEGSVFVFDKNSFILHKSGFSSIIYESDCFNEFVELIKKDSFPNYFHIYDPSKEIIESIIEHGSPFKYRLRNRVKLEYQDSQAPETIVPKEFRILKINETNIDELESFRLELDSKFWKNKTDFIENSYGSILYDQKGPVSICYSAANSDNRAEVDVYTHENHRGKGLATLSVSGFIHNCLQSSIIPSWDCFEDNEASLSLAIKMGFKIVRKYKFLSIYQEI